VPSVDGQHRIRRRWSRAHHDHRRRVVAPAVGGEFHQDSPQEHRGLNAEHPRHFKSLCHNQADHQDQPDFIPELVLTRQPGSAAPRPLPCGVTGLWAVLVIAWSCVKSAWPVLPSWQEALLARPAAAPHDPVEPQNTRPKTDTICPAKR
jgi:hypothetical protein